ncbi:Smr/MutS family protein [Porphyromonas cangingivalis]|nr:Smr/MutS family protein [Porphyromonas cangingivalis]
MQSVTYFIDDAIRFAYSPVRILHGTGTGALREAIRQQLSAIPLVKRYKDEHVDLGGAGITVVELDL